MNNNQEHSVRLASREDAMDAFNIRRSAADLLTSVHGEGHWSTVTSVKTIRKHAEAGLVYLFFEGDSPIGTFHLVDRKIGFYKKEWFEIPDQPAFYLMHMALHPDRQRKGLGREMMIEIEAIAVNKSIHSIRFDAYNADAGAGKFYEKCGYQLVHKGSFNSVALLYFEKVLEAYIT